MSDELSSLDPNVQWIVAEARRRVTIDAAARARLLDAVRAEPVPQRYSRTLAWLRERRLVLPPLAALAAAAGLVGIGVVAGLTYNRDGRSAIEQGPPVAVQHPQLPDSLAARVIKFVLIAPQAARVSLVGDFNDWDLNETPAERQPDGTWISFVPLHPGRHVYSFVVDGQFVSDPAAPMAPDDGYGQKNSVVVVGASS